MFQSYIIASPRAVSAANGSLDTMLSQFTAEVLQANNPPSRLSLWVMTQEGPMPVLVMFYQRGGFTPQDVQAEAVRIHAFMNGIRG